MMRLRSKGEVKFPVIACCRKQDHKRERGNMKEDRGRGRGQSALAGNKAAREGTVTAVGFCAETT